MRIQYDTLWTLVAVYGPNNDEPQFFTNLQRKIESLDNSSVIIGGDWNVPLDYSMDTNDKVPVTIFYFLLNMILKCISK
jgi:hypothetical protein